MLIYQGSEYSKVEVKRCCALCERLTETSSRWSPGMLPSSGQDTGTRQPGKNGAIENARSKSRLDIAIVKSRHPGVVNFSSQILPWLVTPAARLETWNLGPFQTKIQIEAIPNPKHHDGWGLLALSHLPTNSATRRFTLNCRSRIHIPLQTHSCCFARVSGLRLDSRTATSHKCATSVDLHSPPWSPWHQWRRSTHRHHLVALLFIRWSCDLL